MSITKKLTPSLTRLALVAVLLLAYDPLPVSADVNVDPGVAATPGESEDAASTCCEERAVATDAAHPETDGDEASSVRYDNDPLDRHDTTAVGGATKPQGALGLLTPWGAAVLVIVLIAVAALMKED